MKYIRKCGHERIKAKEAIETREVSSKQTWHLQSGEEVSFQRRC